MIKEMDMSEEEFLSALEQVFSKQFVISFGILLDSLSEKGQKEAEHLGKDIAKLLNEHYKSMHPALVIFAMTNVLMSGIISSDYMSVLEDFKNQCNKIDDVGVA